MEVTEIYQEILTEHPNLVKRLLDKSSNESDIERQTIYGELMGWMKNYYTLIPLADREQVVRLLLGDYVIRHPYCLQKVYIVQQESNVDGELIINAVPCATREAAKKLMQDKIRTLLNESHFIAFIDRPDDFILEQTDTSYYIEDTCDDYYEDIRIIEKVIVIR
jgi:hypothetical protein